MKNYFFCFVEMAIFKRMDEPENKYLQKVDLNTLQKETGLDLKGLADIAGIGPKVVYKWAYLHKDSSRPDYNAIIRLLLKGATVKTLFGVDYDALHPQAQANSASEPDNSPIDYSDPKFQEGFEKTLAGMKARGMIKDEVAKTIAEMKANGEL